MSGCQDLREFFLFQRDPDQISLSDFLMPEIETTCELGGSDHFFRETNHCLPSPLPPNLRHSIKSGSCRHERNGARPKRYLVDLDHLDCILWLVCCIYLYVRYSCQSLLQIFQVGSDSGGNLKSANARLKRNHNTEPKVVPVTVINTVKTWVIVFRAARARP